ncbi:AAA family ATPase [Mucilaginibacter paludis]|uniref:ATPase-like protein n=1 Tax=Mucilaginibacter paludis DSM 18603 TaxID=714943 RepID=H1YC28_9SPHI|nr:AAA family ATPase [Mucilaginibacter paludis]EHQ29591.1 ATPase-like protein [Mucilaginibacter paludis DSM 18603]
MDYINIRGFKSIKDVNVKLLPINILIGGNGAGKSNFLSFFEFLNQAYHQTLKTYVALNGGIEKMLHQGAKTTNEIAVHISFNNQADGYSFRAQRGEDSLIFTREGLWNKGEELNIDDHKSEAQIKLTPWNRGEIIRKQLDGLKKYHFHDTGKNSPFNNTSHIGNDSYYLYERGENLAAFMYGIQNRYPIVYNRIIKTIKSIAPYFSDFYFQPNTEGYLKLQWRDKYSSTVYGASDLSDGTIRFIALTTLFMQPALPGNIIIDEPELGLHPYAIAKLSGMIKSAAAKGTQVIIATQSSDLVNHFEPEQVLTVDQINGESKFTRLKKEELELWLDEYAVGDLWERNVIEGGQPQ